ncbi:hypothetical protein RJ55_05557 [Drechmeria coniospora]|nr:hypothetical protein RJ55_05557 [Drechmeria coniospora]
MYLDLARGRRKGSKNATGTEMRPALSLSSGRRAELPREVLLALRRPSLKVKQRPVQAADGESDDTAWWRRMILRTPYLVVLE